MDTNVYYLVQSQRTAIVVTECVSGKTEHSTPALRIVFTMCDSTRQNGLVTHLITDLMRSRPCLIYYVIRPFENATKKCQISRMFGFQVLGIQMVTVLSKSLIKLHLQLRKNPRICESCFLNSVPTPLGLVLVLIK